MLPSILLPILPVLYHPDPSIEGKAGGKTRMARVMRSASAVGSRTLRFALNDGGGRDEPHSRFARRGREPLPMGWEVRYSQVGNRDKNTAFTER